MSATAEEWLVKMGLKGADVVLSQYKKIENAKKQFQKSATGQLATKGFDAFQRTLGTRGGIGSILGKGFMAATQPKPQSDVDKLLKEEQKQALESNRLVRATGASAQASLKVAEGLGSLDASSFIRSVASAGTSLVAGLAEGGGNALWGGLGTAAKAGVEYFGKLTDIAISMSSNAVQAYKSAVPIATQHEANKAFLEQIGGKDIKGSTVTHAEAAAIGQSLFPMFGKIGPDFARQLDRLFAVKNGQTINREQANAVAGGNFGALGSDKGFFLNQIMSGLGNAPPSLRQKAVSQIQGSLADSDFIKESKFGTGLRQSAVTLESEELRHQTAIASTTNAASLQKTNEQLNGLSETMVQKAEVFSGALGEAAAALKDFLNNFVKINAEAKAAKDKGIRENVQQGN